MRALLHCDGGGTLGVGHVMRSLALAEAAVAAGHQVVVAGQFEGSFLARQLAAAPIEVAEVTTPVPKSGPNPLLDLIQRYQADLLHIDSYKSYEWYGWFIGSMVLSSTEDGAFGRRAADVVIDPTFGAERSRRPEDGSTWLLRGPRYTPVRQQVIDAHRKAIQGSAARQTPGRSGADRHVSEIQAGLVEDHARRVLVVMGGTDPRGLAPTMVELLAGTGLALEVTAIAVGENARRARMAAEGSALSLKILAPVDDVAAMMAAHDLVISAAGTSVGELCCVGVPAVVAWAVDNQRAGYEQVVAAGAAIGLGGPDLGTPYPGAPYPGAPHLGAPDLHGHERAVELLRTALTDSRVRAQMVSSGRRAVDGLGAWRVVRMWETAQRLKAERFLKAARLKGEQSEAERLTAEQSRTTRKPGRVGAQPLATGGGPTPTMGAAGLVARPATMGDARQLWQWRNDPAARAGSRSSAEVPWDEHLQWLAGSLERTDRLLLVVEAPLGGLGTVGTARWDLAAEPAGAPGGGLGGDSEWEVSVTLAPRLRGRSLARPLLRAAEVALSEYTSERTRSERMQPEVVRPEVVRPEVSQEAEPAESMRSSGTGVTAYLAVVQIDNQASTRLFESSGYLPDLPPDRGGFMRYRKPAQVP